MERFFPFLKSKSQLSSERDNIYSLEKIDIVYSNPKINQNYESVLHFRKNGVVTHLKIEADNLENLLNKTRDLVKRKT